MKKYIIIAALIMVLFTIGLLFIIHMILVHGTLPSLQRAVEKLVVEETPQMNYAIPGEPITNTQELEERMNKTIKKRQILNKRELDDERARAVRRAKAFSQLKAQEAFLIHAETQGVKKQTSATPLPHKNTEPPSEEKLKEMESKGILAY